MAHRRAALSDVAALSGVAAACRNAALFVAGHVHRLTDTHATTAAELTAVAEAFGLDAAAVPDVEPTEPDWGSLARTEDEAYLTHPVFSSHRSETALLRYLRSLSDKDYAGYVSQRRVFCLNRLQLKSLFVHLSGPARAPSFTISISKTGKTIQN